MKKSVLSIGVAIVALGLAGCSAKTFSDYDSFSSAYNDNTYKIKQMPVEPKDNIVLHDHGATNTITSGKKGVEKVVLTRPKSVRPTKADKGFYSELEQSLRAVEGNSGWNKGYEKFEKLDNKDKSGSYKTTYGKYNLQRSAKSETLTITPAK